MFEFLPFGRKQSGDPLSGAEAVERWLDGLPPGDPLGFQSEVAKSVARLNRQQTPPDASRLEVLLRLDQRARPALHALCRQYLLNPRMPKAMEAQLWNAINAYHWELARGYYAFLSDHLARPAEAALKPRLPLVTARVIHYFAMGFKWRYFRFEQVDEKSWRRFHNLYRFAEFGGFAAEAVELYPGPDGGETSCARQFVQALMLDFVNSGSLFPRQLEMAATWLCAWSSALPLARRYDPERHSFYVDLAGGRRARRVRRPAEGDKCRYWGSRELIVLIDRAREGVRAGNGPEGLGLGEECKAAACLELLDQLARQWAPTVPRVRRRHERRRVILPLDVIHGVRDLFTQIRREGEAAQEAGLSYEEMVDVHLYGFVTERTRGKRKPGGNPPPREIPRERWLMENESEGGFGATVDRTQDDWLRPGRLVGLKPERGDAWQVAVVRRLSRHGASLRYIGMEVLASRPQAAVLRPRDGQAPAYSKKGEPGPGGRSAAAILLPAREGENDESLILEAAEYAPGRVFDLVAAGPSRAVRLGKIVQEGDDWLRVRLEPAGRGGVGPDTLPVAAINAEPER